MSLIADAEFVDLYLGHDFADVKGLAGQPRKAAAPPEWLTEIQELRARCLHQYETTREPEFALVLEDRVLLRVTYNLDVFTKPFFVLNRSRATIILSRILGYRTIFTSACSPKKPGAWCTSLVRWAPARPAVLPRR